MADKAIDSDSAEPLLKLFPENSRAEIQDRFRDAISKKNFDKDDVEAGRKYVGAYTSFLEYLEHLYERISQKAS